MNRTESPEINLDINNQFIFKDNSMRKMLFKQTVLQQLDMLMPKKKKKLSFPYFVTHVKFFFLIQNYRQWKN